MSNDLIQKPAPTNNQRTWLQAAIYYFQGDGKKFLLVALRPFAGILVALGIIDDIGVIGIADDFLALPALAWILIQIWRRRNIRRFP
jgi:hypothetical protein